jgi:intergrase/recombinase
MKYKPYEQDPHSALEQVKAAFDDEKPYKAQAICLNYFMYIENQRQINKALDYSSKDEVYKYLVKEMENKSKNKIDQYVEEYKIKIEETKRESEKYSKALAALEKNCTENGIDLNALVNKLPNKMTKEELIEANKDIIKRQKGKLSTYPSDAVPQPTFEQMKELAEKQSETVYKELKHLLDAVGCEMDN